MTFGTDHPPARYRRMRQHSRFFSFRHRSGFPPMRNWYRINRIGMAGVLAALFLGGIEILVFLADGVQRADLNSPAALLAELLTSERRVVYQIVVGLQLAIVPL